MSLTQVLNIARREYLARVRNKAFIFTTLLVPALMGFYVLLPTLLDRADVDVVRLVLIDAGTGTAGAVADRLGEIDEFDVEIVDRRSVDPPRLEEERAALAEAIVAGEISGYILLRPDDETGVHAHYYARDTGNPVVLATLQGTLRGVFLQRYVEGSGLDAGRLERLVRWDLAATNVSAGGEEEGGFMRAWLGSLVFVMILYITILMGGQQMGMSIVEEKSSQLIELILGAVTATEFMAGKIVGVLGAGLTQLAVWLAFGLLASLYVLPMLAVGASMQGVDLGRYLDPVLLFYFAVFFVLGYLFYAVLFAAVASTCTSSEEFTQVAMPVATMPMMLGLFFTFYAVPNAGSTITRVVSLIPPFTPLVMVARLNALMPPHWEIWLGILLLAGASAAAIWVSAKIFRFALLIQGKRPTFGTVLRLLRAA